jgi:hypothetical protein
MFGTGGKRRVGKGRERRRRAYLLEEEDMTKRLTSTTDMSPGWKVRQGKRARDEGRVGVKRLTVGVGP